MRILGPDGQRLTDMHPREPTALELELLRAREAIEHKLRDWFKPLRPSYLYVNRVDTVPIGEPLLPRGVSYWTGLDSDD